MNYGAVFPTCEIGNDPHTIRSFAVEAESLGYTHLVTYDHVLGVEHAGREQPLLGPYDENDAFHEPFVLFAFLAAATTTLHFETGVLILPQRQTALVAKQAAELAVLSGDRFRLGVGVGWNWVEYEALGVPWEKRGKRMDEQIEVLKALLGSPLVDYRGALHHIERAGILPRPEKPVPLWFGGMREPAVARAARHGDGFVFASVEEPAQKLAERLRAHLLEAGRDPATFDAEVIVPFGRGGADDVERWRRARDRWQALGANHFSMRAMSTGSQLIGEPDPGFTSPQQHIDALGAFIEAMR